MEGLIIILLLVCVILFCMWKGRGQEINSLNKELSTLKLINKKHQALWDSQHWELEEYNKECG